MKYRWDQYRTYAKLHMWSEKLRSLLRRTVIPLRGACPELDSGVVAFHPRLHYFRLRLVNITFTSNLVAVKQYV
jgi:hypothetical protein